MTAAFLPRFVEEDHARGRPAASALLEAVSRQLVAWLGTAVVAVEPILIGVLMLCRLSEHTRLLVELIMLMLPYSILICVAALHCAALNGVQHFFVPAMLPVALNVVWMVVGLLAAWLLSSDVSRIRIIALSVVAGGVLQLLMAARTSSWTG